MADEKKKTTETKQASKSKSTPESTVEKTDPFIYIGPNLPGGKMAQFTVFKSKLPTHVQKLIEKEPFLKRLIVPVSKMPNARANMAKTGTPEHQAVNQILRKESGVNGGL